MTRFLTTAGLCLILASGAALAQGAGQGSDGKGNDAGQQNQNSPVRTDNPPSSPSTSGITTQSTTPSSADRPSAEQCRSGWSSSMRWTRAEFEAACR